MRLINQRGAAALGMALAPLFVGCRNSEPGSRPILSQVQDIPRNLVREVDPLVPANKAAAQVEQAARDAQQTLRTLDEKLAAIDVSAINGQIGLLNELTAQLNERVAQVPPELGADLARQINAADLNAVRVEVECFLGALQSQVETLRVDELNRTLSALHGAVEEIAPKVSMLDVQSANRALVQAGDATETLNRSLGGLSDALSGLRYSVWLLNALLAIGVVVGAAGGGLWVRRLVRT